MHHFRIAVYEITDGSSASEIGQIAEDGMLPIFEQQPGFQAYSLIEVDEKTVVSLSTWESHAEAEAAIALAADWAADTLASRSRLLQDIVGDALFWAGAAS